MFNRAKPLQQGQVSDDDLTGDEDEDDISTTPIRRLVERGAENTSTTASDNYRLYMAGMSRFKHGIVGMPDVHRATISEGIAQFTVELLQNLLESRSETSSNVVFSPLAVETTLALLYAMAAGSSAEQIASAMHVHCRPVDLQEHVFHHAYTPCFYARQYFTLNNRIHLRARPPDDARENDLPALAKAFDVDLKYVNFAEDAAGVRERANEWLHYLSAFECSDVFPEGSVRDTSSIMLASLTYLRADWKWQFRLQDTVRGAFHTGPMMSRNVVMMRQSGRFPMADFEEIDATALEFRYRRKDKSMVIFLPRKFDGLALLEQNLTADFLLRFLDDLTDERDVIVTLPRFCAKQVIDLQETLSSMGVRDVFTGFADLTGISGTSGYHVSQAMHCAVVCVKEKGQKLMTSEGGSEQFCMFTVNHPFMFCVVGRNPDAIFLMGSVRDVRLPYI